MFNSIEVGTILTFNSHSKSNGSRYEIVRMMAKKAILQPLDKTGIAATMFAIGLFDLKVAIEMGIYTITDYRVTLSNGLKSTLRGSWYTGD